MLKHEFGTLTDDGGWEPIGGVGEVIDGAAGVVTYLSDPWGNTFITLQNAAQGMGRDILPALTGATLPDLTSEWFINAYKISFGTAIFVAVFLLIPQAVRTARGAQAGRDLVESIGLYFGTFLVGAMFGPAFGMILIRFFHSLTDVFVTAGLTGSVATTTSAFEKMLSEADPVGLTGGVVLAVVLMVCIIIGLFLVLLMLLVQLITLYFTGVVPPGARVDYRQEQAQLRTQTGLPLDRDPRRPPAPLPPAGAGVLHDGQSSQRIR